MLITPWTVPEIFRQFFQSPALTGQLHLLSLDDSLAEEEIAEAMRIVTTAMMLDIGNAQYPAPV